MLTGRKSFLLITIHFKFILILIGGEKFFRTLNRGMETKLEHILTNSYKADMISYIKSHPEDFEEVIRLAIADRKPYSWKAAWLLWGCMEKNDPRLHRYIQRIIDVLPSRNDSQQRELLLILQRMELDGKYEGNLFDICIKIWEKIGKKPSVRFNAFRLMIRIAEKHPDLFNEIQILTRDPHLDNLSDGVKKSVFRLMDQNR